MAKTVEEAQAAVDAAQAKLDALKGKGEVSATVAASKELSAAQRELDAAKRGIDTAGKTRQEVIRETVRTNLTEKTQALAEADPMRNPTVRPSAPPPDADNIYYYAWIGGAYGGEWKLYKQAKTGTEAQVASAEARSQGGATQATFETAVGANTLAPGGAMNVPIPGAPTTVTPGGTPVVTPGGTTTGAVTTTPTATPTGMTGTGGPTLARDTFKNTLALFFGAAEAAKPWMDALYGVVSNYYRTGSSAEESFNLALQDARTNPALKPFADRFKGIYALQDMRQQGKPVLVPTIAEYVVSQSKMGDVLTQAGLGNLANEEFTGELIGKGNSVSTVADKVAQVFARIDLAPKAIKDTLSRYFPTVDRATLARTILTGAKGTQELVDELAQYEVLAAAEQQGIGVSPTRPGGLGLDRAREYARLGETYGSITPKLARVAQATPTVSKLAGISGTADIGQAGVEKAVVTGAARELEELQRLSEQEEARFRGQSGMANLGLASQRRANRAF